MEMNGLPAQKSNSQRETAWTAAALTALQQLS